MTKPILKVNHLKQIITETLKYTMVENVADYFGITLCKGDRRKGDTWYKLAYQVFSILTIEYVEENPDMFLDMFSEDAYEEVLGYLKNSIEYGKELFGEELDLPRRVVFGDYSYKGQLYVWDDSDTTPSPYQKQTQDPTQEVVQEAPKPLIPTEWYEILKLKKVQVIAQLTAHSISHTVSTHIMTLKSLLYKHIKNAVQSLTSQFNALIGNDWTKALEKSGKTFKKFKKDLLRKFHPDLYGGSNEATTICQTINEWSEPIEDVLQQIIQAMSNRAERLRKEDPEWADIEDDALHFA